MDAQMSAEDAVGQLTGFDELAIAKHFGEEIYVLADAKPVMFMRALVFAQLRRDGKSDGDAKDAALSMPLNELKSWFLEDEEPFPEEPQTEPGKGAWPVAEPQSA